MEKNLIGYVFDALDDADRHEVEKALRCDSEMMAQVEGIRQATAPLAADADGPEPPKNLVLKTLALVAERACSRLPAAPKPLRYEAAASPRRWFRRDVLVAAALMILVGGLFLPAIAKTWHEYHIQSCKNNLHRFGTSLQIYSEFHDGGFPQVLATDGPRGVAGVFVPLLLDAGALDPKVNVACPAGGFQRPHDYTVADLETMQRERPAQFEQVVRNLAPGYAYSLGFEEDDGLVGLRRELGDDLPIMADCPTTTGRGNSGNHGGSGQNVLFTGGHVRWLPSRNFGEDDIYLNQHNKVLAGLRRSDAVLAAGNASPVPRRK